MATMPLSTEQSEIELVESMASTKRLAQLYITSFLFIIFTGAVRKWIFPRSPIFYVLQDVPITLAYVYALVRMRFTRGYLLLGILALSSVLILLGLVQIVGLGLSPFMVSIGLHNYLLYFPMLVTFPLALTPKYRRLFIKINLLLAYPMAALGLVQALSPTSALINKTSEGETMGLPGADVARITGTFNFGAFFGIWIGTALALCLGEWLLPYHRRVFKSRLILAISTAVLSLTCLISGSRQNILLCALVVFGALWAAIQIRSVRVIAISLGVILSLPLMAALTYVIVPTEFLILQDRLTGTNGTDLQSRILDSYYLWITDPKFSFIGRGIGLGIDAAHAGSVDAYNYTYALSENDTARTVMELGTPVGYFYVAIRFGLMVGFVLLAVKLVRSSPHVLPLACLMFGQVSADLTRAATMTCTQVMVAYAFILGVYFYPEPEIVQYAEFPLPETELVS